jgi:hypothetical protein
VEERMKNEQRWERMGAGTGLLSTLMFVLAFIAFVSTSPRGTPPLPSIENAQGAPAFLAAHLSAVRLELLLRSLAIVLFLWVVGSLWSTPRQPRAIRPADRRSYSSVRRAVRC